MFKNTKKTGFDDVDLVIEIEQTFDVKITNEEAKKIYIVQDLYDLLISKLPHEPSPKSFQLLAFYEFRMNLNKYNIHFEREEFNSNPLSSEIFKENKEGLFMDFPFLKDFLVYTKLIFWLLSFLFILTIFSFVFYFIFNFNFLLNLAITIFIIYSALLLLTKEQKIINPNYTLKEMFLDYFEYNYSKYIKKYKYWNNAEIWFFTRRIIAKYVMVQIKNINKNSRFIEDLELEVDG
jgi:hypothetical protein